MIRETYEHDRVEITAQETPDHLWPERPGPRTINIHLPDQTINGVRYFAIVVNYGAYVVGGHYNPATGQHEGHHHVPWRQERLWVRRDGSGDVTAAASTILREQARRWFEIFLSQHPTLDQELTLGRYDSAIAEIHHQRATKLREAESLKRELERIVRMKERAEQQLTSRDDKEAHVG